MIVLPRHNRISLACVTSIGLKTDPTSAFSMDMHFCRRILHFIRMFFSHISAIVFLIFCSLETSEYMVHGLGTGYRDAKCVCMLVWGARNVTLTSFPFWPISLCSFADLHFHQWIDDSPLLSLITSIAFGVALGSTMGERGLNIFFRNLQEVASVAKYVNRISIDRTFVISDHFWSFIAPPRHHHASTVLPNYYFYSFKSVAAGKLFNLYSLRINWFIHTMQLSHIVAFSLHETIYRFFSHTSRLSHGSSPPQIHFNKAWHITLSRFRWRRAKAQMP